MLLYKITIGIIGLIIPSSLSNRYHHPPIKLQSNSIRDLILNKEILNKTSPKKAISAIQMVTNRKRNTLNNCDKFIKSQAKSLNEFHLKSKALSCRNNFVNSKVLYINEIPNQSNSLTTQLTSHNDQLCHLITKSSKKTIVVCSDALNKEALMSYEKCKP